ncbi:jasmonate-induced protein homolog [Chenopodium quinoa]|uniref:jasmonate-induced protein homolog n=1 Tax=Chenopodium quinoa TaxID=63459 RepID=UPI000B77FAC9|nr:jasmonate-induced protein homolog [Chenopodium quinoa]
MASTQVIPQDHQAALDELVKQAQNDVVPRMVSDSQQQEVALLGNLKNLTTGAMNLHAEKMWSGSFFQKYRDDIPSGVTIGFSILANIQDGIKSAVVYSGRSNSGHQCGWLVAWSNPRDIHAKKVYVECRPIAKYNNINWEIIESELNKSSSNSSHSDTSTQTSIHARILSMEHPVKSESDGITIASFN